MVAFPGMSIVFSHISALEALRAATAYDGCTAIHSEALRLCDLRRSGWQQLKASGTTASEAAFACKELFPSLTPPVHFMVAGRNAQRAGQDSNCHVCVEKLPPGSLVDLGRDCYCASPELCLFQLAGTQPLATAVKAGYELCGTFNIDARSDAGFTCRDPLTTPDRFQKMLTKLGSRPGIRNARAVAKLILAGAASPMEAALAMLLTFPRRSGGYGLPRPTLNQKVECALPSRRTCICDLYWPAHRVAVEYDSDAWHTGSDRIARDAERRILLERSGIRVLTITNHQVRDRRRMDEAAYLLSKLLGVRMRDSTGAWTAAKKELREQVLAADPSERTGGMRL